MKAFTVEGAAKIFKQLLGRREMGLVKECMSLIPVIRIGLDGIEKVACFFLYIYT